MDFDNNYYLDSYIPTPYKYDQSIDYYNKFLQQKNKETITSLNQNFSRRNGIQEPIFDISKSVGNKPYISGYETVDSQNSKSEIDKLKNKITELKNELSYAYNTNYIIIGFVFVFILCVCMIYISYSITNLVSFIKKAQT